MFKHSLLASSTTNDPSSWRCTSTITTSVFPTRIYETHISEIFETKSRIFNHCNQSFCKKCITNLPSTRYSIYSLVNQVIIGTSFSKLQHRDEFEIFKQFYENSSPGLKSFSLTCVETYLKIYNLSVQKYGTMSNHPHERVQKTKEPISSLPSQLR